ncbi:MAG: hypothetical protein LBB18_03890 [Puniceicoccales bacterium]|nr:hypothetical protein [Puniceicoccales bacterium]
MLRCLDKNPTDWQICDALQKIMVAVTSVTLPNFSLQNAKTCYSYFGWRIESEKLKQQEVAMKIKTADEKYLDDFQKIGPVIATIQKDLISKAGTLGIGTIEVENSSVGISSASSSSLINVKSKSTRLPNRAIFERKISPKKKKHASVSLKDEMEAVLDRLRICHCKGIYGKGKQMFTDRFSKEMNCLLGLLKKIGESENARKGITASQMKNALMWMDTVLQSLGHTDDQWSTVRGMIKELKDQGVW